MNVYELEVQMWEAAKNRDAEAFLEVVDESAVMFCGGFRCTGADYARLLRSLMLHSTGFQIMK